MIDLEISERVRNDFMILDFPPSGWVYERGPTDLIRKINIYEKRLHEIV